MYNGEMFENRKANILQNYIQKSGVKKTMEEFKEGKLKTGSGKKVTDRKQAIAIGLSEEKEKSMDSDSTPSSPTHHTTEELLEKSGEGSRGGKVIGYTKSGKPIYEASYKHVSGGYYTERKSNSLKDESGKSAALRISKDFKDGKHGISISTDNGEKRYLIHKDHKSGIHEVHNVDKKTYDKATGTDSYAAGNNYSMNSSSVIDKKGNKDTVEKSGQSYPIGTIHNGYKKVENGVWKKVSKYNMTKDEHENKVREHRILIDRMISSSNDVQNDKDISEQIKQRDLHNEGMNGLDDKEYTDEDVNKS